MIRIIQLNPYKTTNTTVILISMIMNGFVVTGCPIKITSLPFVKKDMRPSACLYTIAESSQYSINSKSAKVKEYGSRDHILFRQLCRNGKNHAALICQTIPITNLCQILSFFTYNKDKSLNCLPLKAYMHKCRIGIITGIIAKNMPVSLFYKVFRRCQNRYAFYANTEYTMWKSGIRFSLYGIKPSSETAVKGCIENIFTFHFMPILGIKKAS